MCHGHETSLRPDPAKDRRAHQVQQHTNVAEELGHQRLQRDVGLGLILVAQVCAADRSRPDVEQPDRAKEPGFSRLNVPYGLAEAATL